MRHVSPYVNMSLHVVLTKELFAALHSSAGLKHKCVFLFALRRQTVQQLFEKQDGAFCLFGRFTLINETVVVKGEIRMYEYSGIDFVKGCVVNLEAPFVIRSAPLNLKDESTSENDADAAGLEELEDYADVLGLEGEPGENVVLDESEESDAITSGENEIIVKGAVTCVHFAMSAASNAVSGDSLLIAKNGGFRKNSETNGERCPNKSQLEGGSVE